MFNIRADKGKNRLYIKLGPVDTGEGEQILKKIKSETALLRPGFAGVSDISDFKLNDPKEGVWAERILKCLGDSGMSVAVRVTGLKGKSQKKTGRHGKPLFIVETVKKADAILDRLQDLGSQ